MKKFIVLFTVIFSFFSTMALAETVADYLILQDIGRYKVEQPKPFWDEMIGGPKTGRSGNDAEGYSTWYDIGYDGGEGYAAPGVTVSVYDSTQWMLHELERDLKEYQDGVSTITNKAAATEIIDGKAVIVSEIGGGNYRWISDDKTIIVKYYDLHFDYQIPMEVISAYLKKYPSTLPTTYQIRHPDREKEFVREEFDRLITVADRWVSLVQEADPSRAEKLKQAADNLTDFARYRSVYFKPLFGDPMEADIELLETAHMGPNLEATVRTKLAEYKEWWAEHKSDSISLP